MYSVPVAKVYPGKIKFLESVTIQACRNIFLPAGHAKCPVQCMIALEILS